MLGSRPRQVPGMRGQLLRQRPAAGSRRSACSARRRRLRGRIDGLHSISGYVSEMSERDFLDARPPVPAARRAADHRDHPELPRRGRARRGSDAARRRCRAEPFILFVGALRRVKGMEVLLDAYERLADPPPLVLLGTRERDTPAVLPRGAQQGRSDAPLGGARGVGAGACSASRRRFGPSRSAASCTRA